MSDTPYNAFEHLCSSLFLSPESKVVMLTAYFDESYNYRTEKNPNVQLVYTVAGWVSTAEKWKQFGKEWRIALRQAGIDEFHMKDYESRIGVYEDWIDNKRIRVIKRLHRLIRQHVLYGFNASVNRASFEELMMPEAKKNIGKAPYGFNVRLCLREIGNWADANNINEPIHYVFSHLKKQGSELDWIFERCLNNPELRRWFRMNGMWTKAFAKDVVQLQAADIFAYEVNKHVVNFVSRGKRPTRKSFLNLSYGNKFTDPLYFGREELTEWVNKF